MTSQNDYSFLKAGLRWAREKLGQNRDGRGAWCILEITGVYPFLKAEIIYVTGFEQIYTGTDQPDRWEYGPEIEIPSNAILEEGKPT